MRLKTQSGVLVEAVSQRFDGDALNETKLLPIAKVLTHLKALTKWDWEVRSQRSKDEIVVQPLEKHVPQRGYAKWADFEEYEDKLTLTAKKMMRFGVKTSVYYLDTAEGLVVKASAGAKESFDFDADLLNEAGNPTEHPPLKPGESTAFEKTHKVKVVMDADGSFTAMTRARSKNFKTYKGALKWLRKNASSVMAQWTEGADSDSQKDLGRLFLDTAMRGHEETPDPEAALSRRFLDKAVEGHEETLSPDEVMGRRFLDVRPGISRLGRTKG